MSDVRELLDKKSDRFEPSSSGWDRMQRRAGRRQRNRRIGAAVVALAVFIGGGSGLWVAFRHSQARPGPATPSVHPFISARINVDTSPVAGLAVAGSKLWVSTAGEDAYSRQWVIDTTTNAVDPNPMVAEALGQVAYGEGAVWINESNSIARVDPDTGEVTGTVKGVGALDFAFAAGSVWVTDGGQVQRIDPATASVVATIPLPQDLNALAAGAGSIWAAGSTGVWRIDTKTDKVTGKITLSTPNALAFGEGALWVGETASDSVVRVDPSSLTIRARVSVGGNPIGLAVAQDAVWSLSLSKNRPGGSLVQIDPTRNRLVGRPLVIEGSPLVLTAGAGTIWVGDADQGLVTRIDLLPCQSASCVAPVPSPTPSQAGALALTTLRMFTPTEGWAVSTDPDTARKRVLTTHDGGSTWIDMTPAGIQGDESGVVATFFDSSHGWVAWPRGRPGGPTSVMVFATDDGGRSWKASRFTSRPGWDGHLQFVDPLHGWAVATIAAATGHDPQEIWRTMDGGTTWTSVSLSTDTFIPGLHPGTAHALPECPADVAFVDSATGYAVSLCNWGTQLLATHDAGQTWFPVSISPPFPSIGGPGSPVFTSRTDGFIPMLAPQGQAATGVYVTRDGGRSWTLLHLPVNRMEAGPTFSDSQHGWFTARKEVYATTDGGLHWSSFMSNVPLAGSTLQFIDQLHGWAFFPGGDHPWLLRTDNGGRTWEQLTPKREG